MTGQRKWSWNFVVGLFICGCIVGFISNKDSLNLFKQQTGLLKPQKTTKSETVYQENTINYQAVAVRDSALKKHPLYPEVEKLTREIATRTIEQSAYDDLLQEWESQTSSANPQKFLGKQLELVTNSVAKLKDDLLIQIRKEMVLEKENLQREAHNELEKAQKQILEKYQRRIALEEEQYLQELAYLERRQNSTEIQARYSIRVDIGFKNKQTDVNRNEVGTKGEANPEKELEKKQQEWQQRLIELKEEQKNELDDLLVNRLNSLAKKEKELEITYKEKENYYLQAMTKEVQAAEKRRSELARALENIEHGSAQKQRLLLLNAFKEKQQNQLANLLTKKEKLLKRIEQECLEGLKVLAIKRGCRPGILVDKIPNNAVDLTEELLLLLNRQENNQIK